MESTRYINASLGQVDFLALVDRKDAYLHVPIFPAHHLFVFWPLHYQLAAFHLSCILHLKSLRCLLPVAPLGGIPLWDTWQTPSFLEHSPRDLPFPFCLIEHRLPTLWLRSCAKGFPCGPPCPKCFDFWGFESHSFSASPFKTIRRFTPLTHKVVFLVAITSAWWASEAGGSILQKMYLALHKFKVVSRLWFSLCESFRHCFIQEDWFPFLSSQLGQRRDT